MGLSPSTLFHFTSKENLKGILKDNFKLKYCIENIEHDTKPIGVGIPMVSFCDIKLSEIKDHISKYGSYGIGLSKNWAFEKGLNPVIYLNTMSSFPINLFNSIREIREKNLIPKEEYYNLSNIVRYSKIYEGQLTRKDNTIPNYRFADEREWRYVPEMKEKPNFKHWLTLKQYDTDEKKDKENLKLKDERLTFNANQIKYIIVEKESEINELINHLRAVKGDKYSTEEIERLYSRVITCEQIYNDF